MKKAQHLFHFQSQVGFSYLTGKKARNLKELLKGLENQPGSVIYHHTHRFLKQHQFLSPEPPNDFAYWVSNILKEEALGERLAAVDIVRYPTLNDLKEGLIIIIKSQLRHTDSIHHTLTSALLISLHFLYYCFSYCCQALPCI